MARRIDSSDGSNQGSAIRAHLIARYRETQKQNPDRVTIETGFKYRNPAGRYADQLESGGAHEFYCWLVPKELLPVPPAGIKRTDRVRITEDDEIVPPLPGDPPGR